MHNRVKVTRPGIRGVAIGLTLLALAAARPIVVIETSDPDLFPLGMVLNGSEKLSIPGGVELKLADGGRNIVRVKGPYEGAPGGSASGTGFVDSLFVLFRELSLTSVNVIRGESGATPTDPWVLDLSTGGSKCALGGEAIEMWRPTPAGRSSIVIRAPELSVRQRISWSKDVDRAIWPDAIPLIDSVSYVVHLDNRSREFVIHVLREGERDPAARLAWLVDSGCRSQAVRLVDSLPAGEIIDGPAITGKPLF